MKLELFPAITERKESNFPLIDTIITALSQNGISLRDGDILAVSSKFIAISEGRIVALSEQQPNEKAQELAMQLQMDPRLAQLVIDEAEDIFSGVEHFVLTIKDGVIVPNAGIDKSNAPHGFVVLYPKDPWDSAESIRREIFERTKKKIGVVVTDSRLMPTRIGTTGIAIGVAGFEPVRNDIGRLDLFGNKMTVTKRALADDISAAAQILMGETDERTPIVVVRSEDPPWVYTDRPIDRREMVIDYEKDIYIRGLSNHRK